MKAAFGAPYHFYKDKPINPYALKFTVLEKALKSRIQKNFVFGFQCFCSPGCSACF